MLLYQNSKKSREHHKESLEELERPMDDAPDVEERVRVISMNCFVESAGIHGSRPQEVYHVLLERENGETVHWSVDRELYLTLSVGSEGTSATVNGNYISFIADESQCPAHRIFTTCIDICIHFRV